MAKVLAPDPVTGTFGGMITIYKMGGRYYVRKKSALTGRRVKRSPVFRRTMENANRLGQASRIASRVYRQLPDGIRVHPLYRRLTGQALTMLQEGSTPEVTAAALLALYLPKAKTKVTCQLPRAATLKLKYLSVLKTRKTAPRRNPQKIKSYRPNALSPFFLFSFPPFYENCKFYHNSATYNKNRIT